MKKATRSLLFIASLFLLFQSCKKESSTSNISLSVSAPNENQEFLGGQILNIKGTTSDDAGLHTLTVEVTDDKTGLMLFSKKPTVLDLKTYNFDESWTIKVNVWTDATVKVTSENHSNQVVVKSLKIKLWL
jgi:type 1 fimbria pilin